MVELHSSMNFHQPSLTKHRDVYSGKSLHVKHCHPELGLYNMFFEMVLLLYHPSHSYFCACDTFKCYIHLKMYTKNIWKIVSILARNATLTACTRISFWGIPSMGGGSFSMSPICWRCPCECVCFCSEEVNLKRVQEYFTKSKTVLDCVTAAAEWVGDTEAGNK